MRLDVHWVNFNERVNIHDQENIDKQIDGDKWADLDWRSGADRLACRDFRQNLKRLPCARRVSSASPCTAPTSQHNSALSTAASRRLYSAPSNRCPYAPYSVPPLKENVDWTRGRSVTPGRPDPKLLVWDSFNRYIRSRSLPWLRDRDRVCHARVTPRFEAGSCAGGCASNSFPVLSALRSEVALTPQQFSNALQARFAKELTYHACTDLKESSPELSAYAGLAPWQWLSLLMAAFSLPAWFILWPEAAYASCIVLFFGFCVSVFMLRVLCLGASLDVQRSGRHGFPAMHRFVRMLTDEELPIYSILIPLYREAHMLPSMLEAIDKLDYPRHKLDIKLILEADDIETLGAVRALTLDDRFDIVRVPYSSPRTKPKACNFALPFARGDYLVIFDAEDRPDPDQLRKAASMFTVLPDDVVCQQARLSFYNADENWLTRQFAIEYAVWFGVFLPGLYALDLIIPLGGTSNHFRTDALRRLKAWDAYNVTEDADLGVRIAACGLRTVMLASTTYEEANCRTANWVRQRSRWQKGYLQTWLVHTRRPLRGISQMGLRKFAGLTLTLLGAVLLGLGPVIGLTIGLGAVAMSAATETFTVSALLTGCSVTLALLGYAVAAVSGWIGLRRTGQQSLACSLLTIPLYWILVCIGTVKGAYQIVARPFHWEKTEHGLSAELTARRSRTVVVSGARPAAARRNVADGR